jgi:hypothetical protein
MAKLIKTNITKNVNYTDSHCNHHIYDSEGHDTGERVHENSQITVNISGHTGIFVDNIEIATKNCSITETCPEGDVNHSTIPLNRLNLQSNTNTIISNGFTTHAGETFSFNSSEYVSVDNINIGPNVVWGSGIHINKK